ncbi:response regulator transcription factor [Variovorax sp. J22P240]|uniref:LuxR C-terminal-related transcriptional regulator n=1 Tax=Variovorax sp. J22P240 TaxID=3053514 RepID=UPI002578E937|nr:response regulator transcription factor [Variovorax sp. J22P240]MDL9998656.1 response regulator transcription factor [Variovorax sp. J22P240]
MPTIESIRVFVIHEDPVMSAGLVAILGNRPGLAVTAEGAIHSAEGVVMPDVVVADYRSGLAFLADTKAAKGERRNRGAKVMVVTPIDREWEIRSAINAGIHGYLLQGCQIDELIDGVTALSQGQRYLAHSVSRRIADSLTRERLTTRETQVLNLLTTGSCNKAIAKELGIAVGTVKVHVKGILEKLDATTRTHAVIVAAQRGLVSQGLSEAPLQVRAPANLATVTPLFQEQGQARFA